MRYFVLWLFGAPFSVIVWMWALANSNCRKTFFGLKAYLFKSKNSRSGEKFCSESRSTV